MAMARLQCVFLVVALVCCYVAADETSENLRRRTSVALPDGGCKLTPPTPVSDKVQPAFVASYPGSGASMVRVIIPALTGLKTGVIHRMVNRTVDSVGIKTHYPQIGNIPRWAKNQVKRVVILIRNPMNAIPSYCNYLYEARNGLGIHSEKAPTSYWLKWRDEQFDVEMYHWMNLIDYWMENEYVRDSGRMILVYEDLISDDHGADHATELARFFDRSPDVKTIDAEAIPCVWEKVVKGKGHIKELRGGGTKRKGSKEREWTIEQLEAMSDALLRLAEKYETKTKLVAILNRYVIAVNAKYQAMLKAALEEKN